MIFSKKIWPSLCFPLLLNVGLCQTTQHSNVAQTSLTDAAALIDNGKYLEAMKQLDALATMQPRSADIARLRGMDFYRQGLMSGAEASFAKAMELNPQDMEAMQMRGVTLYRMGRAAEAIPLLERAHFEVADANVDANYVLGNCYLQTHQYDDARRSFAKQYDFEQDSAEAYLLLAKFLLRQEDVEAASVAARRAISKSPDIPFGNELLGETELAQGRVQDAIASFESERRRNPLYAGIYDHLGDAYMHAGDDAKARQALNRSVLLDPASTGPYIQLGILFLRQNNASMAAMYLQRASRMDPNNVRIHRLLAQCYSHMGLADKAAHEAHMTENSQSTSTQKENPVH